MSQFTRSLYRSAGALVIAAAASCGAPEMDMNGELHEAQTVCAGASTLQGIDVSEFQGNINWASVKASGRQFAIARVGDGMYKDPTFATNWAGIKGVGMVRGVYQFFEPGEDPTAQANILIAAVGKLQAGDLPAVADVEVSGGQSAATIAARLQTWMNVVEAGTGKKPMIYSAPGFWNGSVNSGAFGGYPLWVANWGVNCPNTPVGWTSWKVWQYADNGTVAGIGGAVDLDEFNGTLADLNMFAGGGVEWAAKWVSQSFPLATTAWTITAGQTVTAYLEMKNVGTKTWDGNTKLATTQPRDRASAFADGTWGGANRPSVATMNVPPGGIYKFNFNVHAPAKPGTYFEYFGMLEEGVTWFSDPGQGGPPDNQLEAQILVVAAPPMPDMAQAAAPDLAMVAAADLAVIGNGDGSVVPDRDGSIRPAGDGGVVAARDGGGGADAAASGNGATGGCSCQVASKGSANPTLWSAGLAIVAIAVLRRKKRKAE